MKDLPISANYDYLMPLKRVFSSTAQVEFWSASFKILWGIQMLRQAVPYGMEPVSRAIYAFGHIPIQYVGATLLCVGVVHHVGLHHWHRRTRIICSGIGATIYAFFMFSFWLHAPILPGAYTMPIYTLMMTTRFMQLLWEPRNALK